MYLSICSIVFYYRSVPATVTQIDRLHFKNNNKKLSHRFSHPFILLNIAIQWNKHWWMRLSRLVHSPFSVWKTTNRICFQWQLKLSLQMFILLFACYSVNTQSILLVQFMNFIPCQWSANEFSATAIVTVAISKLNGVSVMHVKLCNFKTTNVILNYDNWKIASI